MPIEFVVFLEDDATEDEQKDLARTLCMLPVVVGVYRKCARNEMPDPIPTHQAPGAMQ